MSISAIFDIRVETLAATLLAQTDGKMEDFDVEQVVVSPKGHARRRVEHDVKRIRKKEFESDIALLFEVNRKGLFDTLPKRLFLRLDEEYKDAIHRTKSIEQQIADARKFFLPFEQAMYHPRIEAEQLEQKWTENFPPFVEKMWGLNAFDDCLSMRQKFLLCYLIPEAYRVVGNWELTGLCFEAILRKPVNLNFVAPIELEIPEAESSSSEMRLGEDAILGTTFKDDMPALKVSIKGITLMELPDYLPEGKKRKIIEELLYSYFLPLDVTVITQIDVTNDAWGMTIGEAVLGYSVQLKEINYA